MKTSNFYRRSIFAFLIVLAGAVSAFAQLQKNFVWDYPYEKPNPYFNSFVSVTDTCSPAHCYNWQFNDTKMIYQALTSKFAITYTDPCSFPASCYNWQNLDFKMIWGAVQNISVNDTAAWHTSGNATTATRKLGTTTLNSISIITNGSERIQLTGNGRAVIKVPFYDNASLLSANFTNRQLFDRAGNLNIDWQNKQLFYDWLVLGSRNNNSGTYALSVQDSSGNNIFRVRNDKKIIYTDGTQANKYILTSDASGIATWKSPTTIFDSTKCYTKLKSDTIQACSPLTLLATSVKATGTFSATTSVTTPTISITSGNSSNILSGSGTQLNTIGTGSVVLNSYVTSGISSGILYAANYGIVADGTTDNTANWNTLIALAKSTGYRVILPTGTIKFASKPNDIKYPVQISGQGLNSTTLLRGYSEGGNNGFIQFADTSNGAKFSDMAIEAAAGTTGGYLVSIISSATWATSAIVLENLWITTQGTNTQNNTIFIDGSAKTSAPAGARDISFKNVHAFGANGYSAIIKSAVGFTWIGGGVYAAGGSSVASGGIQITGTASVVSAYINTNIVTCNGFNLTRCQYLQLTCSSIGAISGFCVANDNTCLDCCVYGADVGGTVTGNWIRGGIRRPGQAWSVN